jgi:hypothetical protein
MRYYNAMEHSYQHRFDYFRKTIHEWHNYHKAHSPGTTSRLMARFKKYEFEYHKSISEHRKTGSRKPLDAALEIVNKAEEEFKLYKKLEFLGTLTK